MGATMLHGEIAIGIAVSLANIAIHSVIMATVSWAAHHAARVVSDRDHRRRLTIVMMATVIVLMAAHLVEITVWSLVYMALGVAPAGSDFYLAFVNYTTLGYGDLLPAPTWRLLGPMAAMNGVLLFGWSTAVIYDVLRSIAVVAPASAHR